LNDTVITQKLYNNHELKEENERQEGKKGIEPEHIGQQNYGE